MGDLSMADGMPNKLKLNIGFLNERMERYPQYAVAMVTFNAKKIMHIYQ